MFKNRDVQLNLLTGPSGTRQTREKPSGKTKRQTPEPHPSMAHPLGPDPILHPRGAINEPKLAPMRPITAATSTSSPRFGVRGDEVGVLGFHPKFTNELKPFKQ